MTTITHIIDLKKRKLSCRFSNRLCEEVQALGEAGLSVVEVQKKLGLDDYTFRHFERTRKTFFKAATLMDIEIANYPFATIKPNHGVGFVRVPCVDKDFGVQCNPRTGYCKEHERFIAIDMIDVAGLVPGAHEGKGMGLEFLNDLNQADCLIHVIDCSGSTNEGGEPVACLLCMIFHRVVNWYS